MIGQSIEQCFSVNTFERNRLLSSRQLSQSLETGEQPYRMSVQRNHSVISRLAAHVQTLRGSGSPMRMPAGR